MLSREICGSGLKDRVTACRKRLRVSRTRHKPLVPDEDEELFPETVAFFPLDGGERMDSEVMLLRREQEVGIT
jgi:hypothetical protein